MTPAIVVLRPAWAVRPRRIVGLLLALALTAAALSQIAPIASAVGPVSVIVSGEPGSEDSVLDAVDHLGGRVAQTLPIVDGFVVEISPGGISALRAAPGVRAVVPNRPVHVSGRYGEGSGAASAVYADVVRAPKVWDSGDTGRGVGVAVIDTGVNAVGDLDGKVVHAEDFTAEQDNVDHFGHGTFVAGLIAGTGAASDGTVSGIAPDAHLVSVKIAGRDGSTDLVKLLAALQWVVTFKAHYGIRVLNLSLGTDSDQDHRIDPLNLAVERVWNSGIVVVAAAGNGGSTPGTIAKPGDDPLVVTVGASDDHTTTSRSDDTLASFSAIGPSTAGVAKPDLVAPGRSVVSVRAPGSTIDTAVPGARIGDHYFKGSGTSFSAAVTAGAAALVLSRSPGLNPNQVKHRLVTGAKGLAGVRGVAAGAGVLDAWVATRSGSSTEANLHVDPAGGGGSLQASRTGGCLRNAQGDCLSDADADAAIGFDPSEYFGSSWAGSSWAGSQWAGSSWGGSSWGGSSWGGSSWAGSSWAGSSWAGSSWAGSSWAGSQWAGSQWAAGSWD